MKRILPLAAALAIAGVCCVVAAYYSLSSFQDLGGLASWSFALLGAVVAAADQDKRGVDMPEHGVIATAYRRLPPTPRGEMSLIHASWVVLN
jgi:amino acid transporter